MQQWKKSMLEVQSWETGPQAKVAKEKLNARAATKSIVKKAVVGGIVAGPAGAVVGGMAGKSKYDAKKNKKY